MKHIFLYVYAKSNLGDDLFIYTITRRYPKTKFYLWSDKQNKENFKRIKNLVVIDPNTPFIRMLQKIRPSLELRYKTNLQQRAQAVVYIGGSIFMEYTAWENILSFWNFLAESFPLYAIGCNFGPYQTEAYRERLSDAFAKMQDVCFRDTWSLAKFPGVNTVRYAPDILFSYPMPKVDKPEKNIFVSLINCNARGEGDKVSLKEYDSFYIENLSHLLNEYLQNGYTVTLASFCKKEGDENAVYKLRQKMDVSEMDIRVKNVFYDGKNVDELTIAIARAESVIATRFHATILALAARRPVLPIVYSDKTLHVLEDVGFQGKVLDLRKVERISFDEAQENFKNVTIPNMESLAKEAEKHFAKLDEILLHKRKDRR